MHAPQAPSHSPIPLPTHPPTHPHTQSLPHKQQEFDAHNWTVFTPHYIVWICPTPYRSRCAWLACVFEFLLVSCAPAAYRRCGLHARGLSPAAAPPACLLTAPCATPLPPCSSECSSQCIHKGRYCSPDPDGNLTQGYSGSDVVQVRQGGFPLGTALSRPACVPCPAAGLTCGAPARAAQVVN